MRYHFLGALAFVAACSDPFCAAQEDFESACGPLPNDPRTCEQRRTQCTSSDLDKYERYFTCIENQGDCTERQINTPSAVDDCQTELEGMTIDCLEQR